LNTNNNQPASNPTRNPAIDSANQVTIGKMASPTWDKPLNPIVTPYVPLTNEEMNAN
jgi:hypothetical protein